MNQGEQEERQHLLNDVLRLVAYMSHEYSQLVYYQGPVIALSKIERKKNKFYIYQHKIA